MIEGRMRRERRASYNKRFLSFDDTVLVSGDSLLLHLKSLRVPLSLSVP